MKKPKFLTSRKFKYGGIATLFTIGVIAAVIIVNVIAAILSQRMTLDIDLTTEKLYTLGDDAKAYVAGIKSDVEILVLAEEETLIQAGTAYGRVAEAVNNIKKASDKVSVKYIDLLKTPALKQEYPDDTLGQGYMIIKSGTRHTVLTTDDYFDSTQTDETGYPFVIAEQAIITGIMSVITEDQIVATIVEGHGETIPSALENLLKTNGYKVRKQSILSEEIAPETDVIVISAPTRDYSEDEIKKIDDFMINNGKYGKNIVYLASFDQPEVKNLEEYLSVDWGISIEKGFGYETETGRMYGLPFCAKLDYVDEELFAKQIANQYVPIGVLSRPIKLNYEQTGGRETKEYLAFAKTARISLIGPDEDFVAKDTDEKGPFSAFVSSTRTVYEGTTPHTSTVIALGGTDFLDTNFTSVPSISNDSVFITVLNDITGSDIDVQITTKNSAITTMQMTEKQKSTLMWIFLIIIPVLCLGTAAFVFFRRRHM